MNEPPPRKRPSKRAGRRAKSVFYVMEIKDWDWSFHFGIAYRPEDGPFGDYRHLHIRGTVVRPMDLKHRAVELTFIPHHEMNPGQSVKYEPKHVGTLDLYHRDLNGRFSMPADALPQVVDMLLANRFH